MPSALNIFKDKEKFIDTRIASLESEVTVLQRELLSLILDDYITKFTYDASGNIINNAANLNRAASIDKVFEQFNSSFQKDVIKKYSNNLLKLTNFSKDYFSALDKDFKTETLDKFPKLQGNINASLGLRQVTRDGKKLQQVVSGGYIDRLGQNEAVRQQLKDYVVNSVSSNTSLKDYQKGFKELLTKTKDVDGELVKYYKNYAYDTFNQVDAASNLYYSDQLGLEFFVYEGSLIKTSRKFCCKRAQKVFSKNDVDSWTDDVNLLGKDTKGSYKPLIERGRWNCRHSIRYISDELANERGITKSKDIVKKQGNCKEIIQTETHKVDDLKPEFKEAKTLKEAEQFALDNGLAKNVDYSDFSVELTNNINETVTNLKKTYPLKINEISGKMQNKGANASAGILQRSILVNGSKMNNVSKHIKEVETLINRGSRSAVDVSNYKLRTLTHEYGHLVFSPNRVKMLTSRVPELKPVLKDFNKLRRDFLKASYNKNNKWLGSYADINDDEFFAEIFAHHTLSKTPNEWSVKFIDFYKKNEKILRKVDGY